MVNALKTVSLFNGDYTKINHPRFIIQIDYATSHNITGRAVYQEVGLGNEAWVHNHLWTKLQKLIPYLEATNQFLKVFDAYRPPEAFDLMKSIIPIEGFFADRAEKSQHCHASAIDVCLCDHNKQELRYPTPFDAYTTENAKLIKQAVVAMATDPTLYQELMQKFGTNLQAARPDYVAPNLCAEINNRNELQAKMAQIGLYPIPTEWWHFNLVPRERYNDYPLVSFNIKE